MKNEKEQSFTKEDIINLRKNYALSLNDFSKIIGCAKKTLISYEQGISTPNDSYMVTLNTLIKHPKVIFFLINSNRSRFTEQELKRISKKIYPFVGELRET